VLKKKRTLPKADAKKAIPEERRIHNLHITNTTFVALLKAFSRVGAKFRNTHSPATTLAFDLQALPQEHSQCDRVNNPPFSTPISS
jgi:hypothetical protein